LTRRGLAEDSRESGPDVVSQDRNQSGPLGSGVLREKVQLRRLDWLVPEGGPVAAALLDRGRQCCVGRVEGPSTVGTTARSVLSSGSGSHWVVVATPRSASATRSWCSFAPQLITRSRRSGSVAIWCLSGSA
jgi:hypothetical protein